MTVERAVPGDVEWAELSAAHMARYLVAAEYANNKRVLDAGSGAGYGASMLKMSGAAVVQGLDLDPQAVEQASDKYGDAGCEFLVDDCEQLSKANGPFDLICCFETIEHLNHPERFLERAGELLTPDGVLLISTPDRAATPPFVNGRPRNLFHTFEWYRQEFADLLAAHFLQVDLRAQVESVGLRSRLDAVVALRQGLMWSNPVSTFLWRKWPFWNKPRRPWRKLSGLAAPQITDYPVLPLFAAPIFGTSCFHFAICRQPKKASLGSEVV